jgi:SAM-dependent methyltransferase
MTSERRSSKPADALTDEDFDSLMPPAARKVSRVFWTSVAVARRAALLLEQLGVRRVLDLGSGPGKFCIVAGARAPRLSFVGVEHRRPLVEAAQDAARQLGLSNVSFSVGDATRVSWRGFDAFYAYNSFAENEFVAEDQFDQTVELSRERHVAEARRLARGLEAAPVGTILVTYHPLSGPIPGSYDMVHLEAAGSGWLRLWRKGVAPARDRFWLEEGADVKGWFAMPRKRDNDVS